MNRFSGLLTPLLRAAVPARTSAVQSIPVAAIFLGRKQFHNAVPCLAAGHRRPGGSKTKIQIVTIDDKIAELPLDEQIDTPEVRVKSDDGGGLSEPRDLFQVLDSIDRSTQHVLQLSKPGEHEYAVVRVVQRKDLIKQIRDKEDAARQAKMAQKEKKPKQIELNWAISSNDLQLKLKQMEDFLRKGKKVELMLAAKRHQRKASIEEAEALMRTIKDKLNEIGAIEVAPMEGGLLKQALMTVKIP